MGKYNDLVAEGGSTHRDYLSVGRHEVTIAGAEIKLGDDAKPTWATKSITFRFENEEGISFYDMELDPLTLPGGEENETGVRIATGNLLMMGADADIDDAADLSREAEQFVMSGAALGAKVEINITEKPGKGKKDDGTFFMNRYHYVNKLIEAGAGEATTAEPVAEVF